MSASIRQRKGTRRGGGRLSECWQGQVRQHVRPPSGNIFWDIRWLWGSLEYSQIRVRKRDQDPNMPPVSASIRQRKGTRRGEHAPVCEHQAEKRYQEGGVGSQNAGRGRSGSTYQIRVRKRDQDPSMPP